MKYALFLAVILAVSFVTAAPEELDDRWVFYGDTFERDDTVYFVERSGDIEKMLLYVDDVPFILNTGTCKDNLAEREKYCIEAAAYEDEDKYKSHIKYESGDQLFAFRLVTYTLIPELDVTRTIKPTTPEYNGRAIITVTIENDGEKDVKNVEYVEQIPEELDLDVIDGIAINGNYSYEIGVLVAGAKKVFQYAVTPKDYGTIKLDPKVTYVYDFIRKEADVKELKFTISEPYDLTRVKSSSTIAVNEEVTYRVTIENDHDTRITYDAEISFPDGVVIDELEDLKLSGEGVYVTDGQLSTGATDQFAVTFHTTRTGTYPFTLLIRAHVDGKTVEKYYAEQVVTKVLKLEPRILFSRTTNKITSGDSATLRLYLKNNEDISYVNIDGVLSSELITQKVTSDVVVAGEDQLVKEFTIVAPVVEKATNKEFKFSGTYETREGEEFTFDKRLTISIQPNNELFRIVHKPNVTKAHPGEAVKMTVTVKNLAERYVFVNIHDTISGNIPVFSGNSFAEISLEGEEQRDVYLYEFVIPEDFTGENITITTHAQEKQLASIQEHTTVITVTERPPEPGSESTAEDDEETDEESESGDGFFTRAWNWIKGLFD